MPKNVLGIIDRHVNDLGRITKGSHPIGHSFCRSALIGGDDICWKRMEEEGDFKPLAKFIKHCRNATDQHAFPRTRLAVAQPNERKGAEFDDGIYFCKRVKAQHPMNNALCGMLRFTISNNIFVEHLVEFDRNHRAVTEDFEAIDNKLTVVELVLAVSEWLFALEPAFTHLHRRNHMAEIKQREFDELSVDINFPFLLHTFTKVKERGKDRLLRTREIDTARFVYGHNNVRNIFGPVRGKVPDDI